MQPFIIALFYYQFPLNAKDKMLWYFYKSFFLTETADIAREITIRSASYTLSVTWRIKKGGRSYT